MAFSGVVTAMNPWVAISTINLWMILGSSFCILGGYFFSIQVMRAGDVGFIAPFRYVSLVIALFAGWFLFDEWPEAITLVGAAIVVGTGLFTLYRERQISRL
jgi:S-adenosylmethionine uptake transporter